MTKRVDVVAFGCRLNTLEGEVMKKAGEEAGLSGAILFNTCAVTNEAVRQSRQAIRKARRENPDAKIIVSGCAAQIDPQSFADMAEVDLVLGNEEKLSPAGYDRLPAFGAHPGEKIRVNDIMSVKETAGHLVEGLEGRARAFVQVQNGCDHRCTFCIIPYGRGNSRSVPMGVVCEQVSVLVENGYREIVLTGVDMTGYGADLPGTPKLGHLVEAILKHVPGLARLRLSSIDSIEVDKRLFAAIAGDERVMPHLHLSLQAGNDLILKRMKRRHLRDEAIRFCDEMRRARPDIEFGADLIAGFPTETEEMFQDSLRLVEECDLTFLHVFPYSARPGTPAARMPQVNGAEIKDRAARLRELGERQLSKHFAAQRGSTRSILIERKGIGRTEHFMPVRMAEGAPGDILQKGITGHEGGLLLAEAA